MLKRTERIGTVSFRISSVLFKVELEPGAGPSHRTFTPAPAPTKKYRLRLAPAPQHLPKSFKEFSLVEKT